MNRSALIHFIIALLFALVAIGAYGMWFFSLSAARENVAETFLEAERVQREDAAIESAKDALAALSNDEAALNAYFVSPEDIASFFEELETSGDSLGSAVEVVSVSSLEEGNGHITIALKIEGSFASVMRTLSSIEYGSRDMRLISLTLDTPRTEEANSWTAAAEFSVATLQP